MRYKFNPYERAVGGFISIAVGGSIFFGIGIAIKKNWFEEKVKFSTFVSSAANIREGSSVFMSGLKVGRVDSMKLDRSQNIKVDFTIMKEYQPQITEGTQVEFIRPFVLGDKAMNLLQGPNNGKVLSAGVVLPLKESFDVFDSLTGKKLETILGKVENILTNLDGTVAMGRDIAEQIGGDKKLKKSVDDLSVASAEIRKAIVVGNMPKAAENLAKAVENLHAVSNTVKAISPEGTQKTMEVLNESVVILRGMQKSWLLKSHVKEVKHEIAEAEKMKEVNRMPASVEKEEPQK